MVEIKERMVEELVEKWVVEMEGGEGGRPRRYDIVRLLVVCWK